MSLSTSWGPAPMWRVSERLAVAPARLVPRDVHPLPVLIILSLGVKEEESWGGGDGVAGPTSPVDGEQMGPDSIHTNHCQEDFSLLQWPLQSDDCCLLRQEETRGLTKYSVFRDYCPKVQI